MSDEFITLPEGSGGKEMQDLIRSFLISNRGKWNNYDDDAATLLLDGKKNKLPRQHLVFTSDSFIVTPIFFPGADIGHLAFSGTVNDLLMMGATPVGISSSLVIEEGFLKSDLKRIMASINLLSKKYGIPIVTGDTKVMEKGKLDGIIINTAGIGLVDGKSLLTKELKKIVPGDKIIISGGLGEHAVALLSKRFDYSTSIISDSKPLVEEMASVRTLIKYAKDPTRGGIASILNEIAEKFKIGILLEEDKIPAKQEVRKVCEMLGINLYELACEGRFISIVSSKEASKVIAKLKRFNSDAAIIGEVTQTNKKKVIMQTFLGQRILPTPSGRIVPRIC